MRWRHGCNEALLATGGNHRRVAEKREPAAGPRRVLRSSALWFSEGSQLKAAARRAQRCVECRRALPDRRSPYCSRRCQWGFRGRYFWDAARTFVLHRDRFTCQVCRRRRPVADLEVDHVVEIARGGPSLEYLNLQTLCRRCHRHKTAGYLRLPRQERLRDPTGSARVDAPGPREWGADWFPA